MLERLFNSLYKSCGHCCRREGRSSCTTSRTRATGPVWRIAARAPSRRRALGRWRRSCARWPRARSTRRTRGWCRTRATCRASRPPALPLRTPRCSSACRRAASASSSRSTSLRWTSGSPIRATSSPTCRALSRQKRWNEDYRHEFESCFTRTYRQSEISKIR